MLLLLLLLKYLLIIFFSIISMIKFLTLQSFYGKKK